MDASGKTDTLVFFINGRKVTEANPDPTATLLQYIRRKLLLPGTKEGCGHGGCGSCTVMLSRYDVITKTLVHYAVNACLFPVCAAHGLAVTTVEGVGSPRTGLHDIQKRLVESHGLQCGFCTPGFVMSAFTMLRNNPQPSKQDVERALEGNLCRCTGYRPILEALSSFTQECCALGENCCRAKQTESSASTGGDVGEETAAADHSTQVPIFPPELQLPNDYQTGCAQFRGGSDVSWYRPTTLADLVVLKDKFPDAPIIMGNTTFARFLKQGDVSNVIYGGSIPELKSTEATDRGVVLGGALTLTELGQHIAKMSAHIEEHKRRHFASLQSMVNRFGSDQVRNVATLAGSIQSGRGNSDVISLLIALNASVTVRSVSGSEEVPLEQLHLNNNHVISHVTLPYTQEGDVFEFYKQSDRRTFSLAIVNCGLYVRLDGNTVKDMRMCLGGVSLKPCVASKTAAHVVGRSLDDGLLHELIPILTDELVDGNTLKDQAYKMSVSTAFLFKFFTSLRKCVETEGDTAGGGSVDGLGDLRACSSSQFYPPCTDDGQPETDPVGRPVPSVASEAIVAGEAVYIDDMPPLQGELFLALVLSTKAHATIIQIDPSDALKLDGVHAFIDHNDIPGKNLFGFLFKDEEFFATQKVIYVGQPIGAVVAETREIANNAAQLVKTEYEDIEPALLTIEDAIEANAYIGDPVKLDDGDITRGFEESAHVIEGTFSTGYQEHFYLEPQSGLVIPRIENCEMEVFCASQAVTIVQENVAELLNIQRNKVTVRTKRAGGAFGGKESRCNMDVGPAAIAAHKFRRPVRCILQRETDMLITGKRHPYLAKYKVGVDKDGGIKALDISCYSNAGCTMDMSPIMMLLSGVYLSGSYTIPNLRFRGYNCKTNVPSNTALRGFGRPQGSLTMETIVTHIADQLKMPPEQVREMNLVKEGHVTNIGTTLSNVTVGELWNTCKETSEFQTRRQEVDNFNRSNRWKKQGLAMTTVHFGVGIGIVALNQGAALVNIYLDGSVLVAHGGIESGQGLNTKILQVASRVLGVPVDKLHTVETSTATVPNTIVTGGSFTTDYNAPAVMDACCTLNERLRPIRDQCPDATWEELIQKAFAERVQLSATGFNKLKMDVNFDIENKIGDPALYITYGAVCSHVEVDVLTGENQVLQSDIIFDVGKSLNPAIDIGQIEGAFVQGLGMVTTEYTDTDDSGRMMNCSPLSYKIPNVRSIPRKLNVKLIKNFNIQTPVYSSKGIGEPPLLGATSVFMAIRDAVKAARAEVGLHGHFRLDSPATVQRIRAACGDQLAN